LSLADLENVVNLAVRNADKKGCCIDCELLNDTFELALLGEEKSWGKEYAKKIAWHACICSLGGKTPNYLTIMARGSHGGYMEHASTEGSPLRTKEELLWQIRTALGGRATGIVCFGSENGLSIGVAKDLEVATRIAKNMLTNYGMDDEFGLVVVSNDKAMEGGLSEIIHNKVNAILKSQMAQAVEIIEANVGVVYDLVEALLCKNSLSKVEIEEVLKGRK